MHCAIIIPARLHATRLPNKPLADLGGLPIVVRVARQAHKCHLAQRVVVATDDERIAGVVRSHQLEAVMTAKTHPSGTDRVWEAARHLNVDLVVNLQGDEPFVVPQDLADVIEALHANRADIITLRRPCIDEQEAHNPNAVKVVCDDAGRALYFSRAPIPYKRGAKADRYIHLGIYGMRRATLERFCSSPPHPLECTEGLEQLRALAQGMHICVLPGGTRRGGIDTPEDLAAARAYLAAPDPGMEL